MKSAKFVQKTIVKKLHLLNVIVVRQFVRIKIVKHCMKLNVKIKKDVLNVVVMKRKIIFVMVDIVLTVKYLLTLNINATY
jgi:hypothetical protein